VGKAGSASATELPTVDGLAVDADVRVALDASGIAQAAAAMIGEWAKAAVKTRERVHIALTGGSSATKLYEVLKSPAWRSDLPWSRIHLWWGDDRFVPSGEAESNFGSAYRTFFDGYTEIPAPNIHPIPIDTAIAEGEGGDWAAEVYRTEILTEVPVDGDLPGDAEATGGATAGGEALHRQLPAFDIVLLGLGPDGHVLSCFPGSPALADDAALVLAVPAPEHVEPHLPRVTLNPRLLEAARHVLVMVPGGAKATVVKRILTAPELDPDELPGRLATGENAVWLLDRGSAAELAGVRLD
jgi:6-phosphogluconolactonase/glucosamine-6-phosphate isomerase/deaminase